ncbi:hypothetical protein ACIRU8_44965 [Streptomyces sp. NPDC101175]|uniref:hypothetical protein n=1 Tax=Streptomyces sp. NPDC101175 TaxID=3366123 RepID=UPI0038323CC2
MAIIVSLVVLLFTQDSKTGDDSKERTTPTATADGEPTGPPPTTSPPPSLAVPALKLSRTSGPPDSVISVHGTGYRPNEGVRIEIFEIKCKTHFPADDHVVVGDWTADPQGNLDVSNVSLHLDVSPTPDCSGGGLVQVRATGTKLFPGYGKSLANATFKFD